MPPLCADVPRWDVEDMGSHMMVPIYFVWVICAVAFLMMAGVPLPAPISVLTLAVSDVLSRMPCACATMPRCRTTLMP